MKTVTKYVIEKRYKVFHFDVNGVLKVLTAPYCNGHRLSDVFESSYPTEKDAEFAIHDWCGKNNGTHGIELVVVPVYCEVSAKFVDFKKDKINVQVDTEDTSQLNDFDNPPLRGIYE